MGSNNYFSPCSSPLVTQMASGLCSLHILLWGTEWSWPGCHMCHRNPHQLFLGHYQTELYLAYEPEVWGFVSNLLPSPYFWAVCLGCALQPVIHLLKMRGEIPDCFFFWIPQSRDTTEVCLQSSWITLCEAEMELWGRAPAVCWTNDMELLTTQMMGLSPIWLDSSSRWPREEPSLVFGFPCSSWLSP